MKRERERERERGREVYREREVKKEVGRMRAEWRELEFGICLAIELQGLCHNRVLV